MVVYFSHHHSGVGRTIVLSALWRRKPQLGEGTGLSSVTPLVSVELGLSLASWPRPCSFSLSLHGRGARAEGAGIHRGCALSTQHLLLPTGSAAVLAKSLSPRGDSKCDTPFISGTASLVLHQGSTLILWQPLGVGVLA